MMREICVGAALPTLEKTVTQHNINLYAEVGDGKDAIHIDPAYAATTAFKKTMAHGLLSVGYVSELLYMAFGEPWLRGGKIKIKFTAPVLVDETISVSGEILSVDTTSTGMVVTSQIVCSNEKGNVLTAEAVVTLPDKQ